MDQEPSIEEIFADHWKSIRDRVDNYEHIIEEQMQLIDALQKPGCSPVVTVNFAILFTIAYLYGVFLGVYMCPK